MAYTFNGASKRITLTSGTTSIVLAEMYSRWKDWVLAGNGGFLPAFTTVGGDIPAIPLYLFLENGWRIVPQAADHVLTVGGGVLEVQGGGDPFVDPAGSYKIRINRQSPGIAIGYSGGGVGAADVAAAVWQRAIEAGMTAEAILRVLLAQAAGDASGLGSATTRFKSLDGTKDRIVGTVSGGSRDVTFIDGS